MGEVIFRYRHSDLSDSASLTVQRGAMGRLLHFMVPHCAVILPRAAVEELHGALGVWLAQPPATADDLQAPPPLHVIATEHGLAFADWLERSKPIHAIERGPYTPPTPETERAAAAPVAASEAVPSPRTIPADADRPPGPVGRVRTTERE